MAVLWLVGGARVTARPGVRVGARLELGLVYKVHGKCRLIAAFMVVGTVMAVVMAVGRVVGRVMGRVVMWELWLDRSGHPCFFYQDLVCF